ncbi:MAG: DNA topoisomerase I [Candidatus Cloacimonadota bacterium]|nr:MAG: DNA topoisomerase I [Candidatus Cloacimonadota bacterium]
MAKGLIIVESPAKAKTISKFLNNQYIVRSSMGHVRDLPKKTLGIDIENNFKPKYVTDRTKSKIIKELREAAKKSDQIFLASDRDREGEAIAWHLKELLKKESKDKPVYRIVFNEITKSAIKNAIEHPGKIDEYKVNAQQARRFLDRIVGYSVSPVLWKVIAKSLSAGRVQSVALRILCEREAEIRAFKAEEYWSVEARLQPENKYDFKSSLAKWQGKAVKISNEEEVKKITDYIKKQKFEIGSIERKSRKIQPYAPYITSTLQQDAARLINFTANRTMQTAQQLYEGIAVGSETAGLITYMRTDSTRIADEANQRVKKMISERFGGEYVNKFTREYKTKNTAQDAHEAIRPTDVFRTPEDLSQYLTPDQLKLYTLIWQRFTAAQMIPAEVNSIIINIEAGDAQFKSQGNELTNQGFIKAYPYYSFQEGENIPEGLAEKEILSLLNLDELQHFTKPPARYSEASLIKELESKGIGRPSTYASITNTILVRKYAEKIEKRFHPTDLGEVVNKFLIANFDSFFNVEFTAEMESGLDEIETGDIQWENVLRKYNNAIGDLIGQVDVKKSKSILVEPTDEDCDKCGSKMVIKWGRKGQFLACPNYPKCSNVKSFTRGEKGEIIVVKEETIDENCPECGNPLNIKNGRYGKFIACSNYPKCKYTRTMTMGIKCPECEKGEFVELKSKKGKIYYGCSSYPDCKNVSFYKPYDFACPECGNYYTEEHFDKSKKKYLVCPECKKEFC